MSLKDILKFEKIGTAGHFKSGRILLPWWKVTGSLAGHRTCGRSQEI
jgi:hypothetical protein